jgi:hypothetical protein
MNRLLILKVKPIDRPPKPIASNDIPVDIEISGSYVAHTLRYVALSQGDELVDQPSCRNPQTITSHCPE